MEHKMIQWGILGLGSIAHEFALAIKNSEYGALQSVASRDSALAKEFAGNYEATSFYGSYSELVNDPTVDVVYIATPHVFHKEQAILALEAGKHVVCEKPFTLTKNDAAEIFALARSKNLFIMEALWTRFFPLMDKLREIIEQKRIGEITAIEASFGFSADFDADSRLFNKELGGGALFDVGVYLLSFVQMVLGAPKRIEAGVDLGLTSVDEKGTYRLFYEGGVQARLDCSVVTDLPNDAKIFGTKGSITIHQEFWRPERMLLDVTDKGLKEYQFEIESTGYSYEIDAVSQLLLSGEQRLEHPLMPWNDTLETLAMVDEIYRQFPF
ncbi:MAG: Gfo/Idh/MocA family oxidoreductase [Fibrobacterales bacterium]